MTIINVSCWIHMLISLKITLRPLLSTLRHLFMMVMAPGGRRCGPPGQAWQEKIWKEEVELEHRQHRQFFDSCVATWPLHILCERHCALWKNEKASFAFLLAQQGCTSVDPTAFNLFRNHHITELMTKQTTWCWTVCPPPSVKHFSLFLFYSYAP